MKVQIEAREHPELQRLIFNGGVWSDWGDMRFCIHGEKLRWSCDECDEWFKRHPAKRKKEARGFTM